MNVEKAYTIWSEQYDSNANKTRDLEGVALRTTLEGLNLDSCLEIGCGTGKNTVWLVTQFKHVTAVDLTEKMLEIAKLKVSTDLSRENREGVNFVQADILEPWHFAQKQYDLVGFSLVLEHIEHLKPIFAKTVNALKQGGYVYIGELHPFKQYSGTKARFETEEGLKIVTCFNHHVSDFTQLAHQFGLEIVDVNEHFDDGDRTTLPRILTVLLRKKFN
jgi:2-polyprenyl-3-methyl-5-hydroxy-6-metoxy-1,4-benzoquinol methylase